MFQNKIAPVSRLFPGRKLIVVTAVLFVSSFNSVVLAQDPIIDQMQTQQPADIYNPQVEPITIGNGNNIVTDPVNSTSGNSISNPSSEDVNGGGGGAISNPSNPRGSNPRSSGPFDTSRNGTPITMEGRDPGGNPDVPFDSRMNLAFLAVGLVFAVVVFRKKLSLKPLPVKN